MCCMWNNHYIDLIIILLLGRAWAKRYSCAQIVIIITSGMPGMIWGKPELPQWCMYCYEMFCRSGNTYVTSLVSLSSAASLGQCCNLASLSSADSATSLSCWLVLSSSSLASLSILERLLAACLSCDDSEFKRSRLWCIVNTTAFAQGSTSGPALSLLYVFLSLFGWFGLTTSSLLFSSTLEPSLSLRRSYTYTSRTMKQGVNTRPHGGARITVVQRGEPEHC